jgi:hypothetical protein
MRSVKIPGTCFLIILFIACAGSVYPQAPTPGPMLLTQENSPRAAALDSATLARDPLPVVNRNNFSLDRRTRLALFGINMDLLPGENASAMTARARDSQSRTFSLNVESVRKVPAINGSLRLLSDYRTNWHKQAMSGLA